MAAKKKKGKKSSKKEDKQSSAFWKYVGGVLLIVVGIILLFGAFVTAPIPMKMWDGVWKAIGAATILMPFALIYLGALKFANEKQEIPLDKLLGVVALIVVMSSWMHTAFARKTADAVITGGHGGVLGKSIGNVLINALGGYLTALIFFIMTIAALFFTLGLSPKLLLKIGQLFGVNKIEGEEGEGGEEDLGALKKRFHGFKLNEGVPVEHHGHNRMGSFKNSAQRVAPSEDHAALTTVSDPDWQFPSLTLLSDKQDKADAGDVQGNAEIIKETFSQFNIDVEVEGANVGPRVTQFTLKPPTGVKLTKLTALENNLALDLAANSIRMEAPIPGKRAVGIEVPNVKAATVTLASIFNSQDWHNAKSPLAFAIGKDIAGQAVVAELDRMPHMLIAGQTGSGKSVMINTLLTSLLYRNGPSDLKLILVDPKQVEMAPYNNIPHLLAPVITEPEKCISALKWAVAEMERRLKTFAEVGKRNIGEYNSLKQEEGMPYIVIVIDELADLMMMAARDVEALIVRIAQKARAAGIHLVLATQRPSVDVITGLIKANVPARIAFTTVSQVDSRTILDQVGAEKLLGRGDLLFNAAEFTKPKRVQGALISDDETHKITEFLRAQREPNYDDEVISQPVQLNGKGGVVSPMDNDDMDDMWKDAVQVVIDSGKASTSLLQRKLRIGYGRASRLVDIMEEQGIIGPADGAKPREVLVRSMDEVFPAGGGNPAPAPQQPMAAMPQAPPQGDIYDDMPDQ